ncbi:MAG: AfsR/SARP family transcriptional regulator [Mycobacterium sp.]
MAQNTRFTLTLIGGFAVTCDGRNLNLPPSCQRLVALVALAGRPVLRSWLCAQLWPDIPHRSATARLRTTLWRLRPPGAEELLDADAHSVTLTDAVDVDYRLVLQYGDRVLGRGGAAGLSSEMVDELLALLRRGELLAGWMQDWNAYECDRYQLLRLSMLDRLADWLSETGNYVDALEVARWTIGVDPLRESSHRICVRTHLRLGNPADAERGIRAYERLLCDELGIRPSGAMAELAAEIAAG